MGLAFTKSAGEAQKSSFFKYQNGQNKFRLVGDILARYVYWVKNHEGNNVMVECLGFDRDKERFTNLEKDWVAHYFPEEKCSWSYLIQCIDLSDGKLKVLPLKKKYFQSIIDAAKRLGDPTDTSEIGWDVVLERKSTGSQAYNVEYTVQVLDCVNRALTEEELKLLEDELKPIDSLAPRQTSDEQKQFIEQSILGLDTDMETTDLPDEVRKVLKEDDFDDTPF